MAAVCILALALVCATVIWLDAACDVPSRRLVMKQSASVGCFEFWLNRYQTLLAGILAVAGAVATVVAV
ncbi:MAG: hypothetical protein B7Z14_05805, partial [Bosea sp. 32-68-6]